MADAPKRVPDGRGGWKNVSVPQRRGWEDVKLAGPLKTEQANVKMQQEKMDKVLANDFWTNVGQCTEALNSFLKVYAMERNLSHEEVVSAIYLELLNNRHFWPKGSDDVDKLCSATLDYFHQHVK